MSEQPKLDLEARIRKVRDGYADQARFADHEPASYFREFVRRIDAALLTDTQQGADSDDA